jgi:hypothetical protein
VSNITICDDFDSFLPIETASPFNQQHRQLIGVISFVQGASQISDDQLSFL